MGDKSFEEIKQRFEEVRFSERFDLIVAIANGGIIPAAILNQRLNLNIELLKIHFRDSLQKPLYAHPQLVAEIDFEVRNKDILLVEDRVKTGATLNYARQLLVEAGARVVRTFAVNGNTDYCLYNEGCFRFPWRTD